MAKKQKSPEEEEEKKRTYSKVRHSLRLVKRTQIILENIFLWTEVITIIVVAVQKFPSINRIINQ